ncbi:MAG: SDR family oxidoreductase [Desulfuromonas sp.]|nr:SDR family oxidoreductase [Desulfuromonas sp.]
MELQGKVALITGGAVRIGRALALALAERGVRIALHYGRSADAAKETAAAIRAAGSDAAPLSADLAESGAAADLIDRALERFGRLDILVNSAAIFLPGGVGDTSEGDWDRQFAINLKSPFFLAQAFARRHQPGSSGLIVNIADWRAFRPGPDYLAYTLTKAGIVAMTQSLAAAPAPRIRVNAIAPGAILPPPGKDDVYLQRLADRIPLRRSGSPDDLAKGLLYLAEADFVTGEVLFIDGGEHLQQL